MVACAETRVYTEESVAFSWFECFQLAQREFRTLVSVGQRVVIGHVIFRLSMEFDICRLGLSARTRRPRATLSSLVTATLETPQLSESTLREQIRPQGRVRVPSWNLLD